jgi:hypothetical protein
MEKRKLKSEIINALKELKQAITNARRRKESAADFLNICRQIDMIRHVKIT